MSMNLDLEDMDRIREIDQHNMLAHIDALADQFEAAWAAAQKMPLPKTPRQIVISGMGGSAIGGDLIAALVSATSPVPITVVRGYDLPASVVGPDTLVIASSYSGNTEETLSVAEQALDNGTQLLAISTGGQLASHAEANGYALWRFSYPSQPRAALGWSFGLLIGLAHRLELAPNLEANMREAISLLREQRANYTADAPLAANPAKRGAGQLCGRIPVFHGGGVFEPVARRWKCQINENAKAWAQYEPMPESNHNAVTGIGYPEDRILNMAAWFITSRQIDHPRVYLRHKLTHQLYMEHGIMVDKFRPAGASALAQMCHAIQYGDYVSFYLAIAYGADPTEIAPIMELKAQLAASE